MKNQICLIDFIGIYLVVFLCLTDFPQLKRRMVHIGYIGVLVMSKCPICKEKLETTFEGDGILYPVYICPEHGLQKNLWKEWWEEYSTRGLKKKYWQKPKDLPSCIVSYFCHLYEKKYNHSFKLSIQSPNPYGSKDFVMARRIIAMFGEDYLQIPNYMKWVFNKISTKYSLKSIGFLASANLINEYRQKRARKAKPKRSSDIPKDFMKWCQENYKETIDYHQTKTLNDLNILIGLKGENEKAIIEEARKRGIVPKEGFINLEE